MQFGVETTSYGQCGPVFAFWRRMGEAILVKIAPWRSQCAN
jgi:hypothetical protein